MAIQANTVGGPLDDIYKDLKLLPTEVLKSYLQNPNNMQADGVSFSLMAGGVLADRARQQAAFAASQQPNPAQIPTVAQTLAQGQPVGVEGVPAGGAGITAFSTQAQQPQQQQQPQQITLNQPKQATPISLATPYAAAKTPLQQQVSAPPTPTRKMAQGGIVAFSGEDGSYVTRSGRSASSPLSDFFDYLAERSTYKKDSPVSNSEYPEPRSVRDRSGVASLSRELSAPTAPTAFTQRNALSDFEEALIRDSELDPSLRDPAVRAALMQSMRADAAAGRQFSYKPKAPLPTPEAATPSTPTTPETAPGLPSLRETPEMKEAFANIGTMPSFSAADAEKARKEAVERFRGAVDPRMAEIQKLYAAQSGIAGKGQENFMPLMVAGLGAQLAQMSAPKGTLAHGLGAIAESGIGSYRKNQQEQVARELDANKLQIKLQEQLMKQGLDEVTAGNVAEKEARKIVEDTAEARSKMGGRQAQAISSSTTAQASLERAQNQLTIAQNQLIAARERNESLAKIRELEFIVKQAELALKAAAGSRAEIDQQRKNLQAREKAIREDLTYFYTPAGKAELTDVRAKLAVLGSDGGAAGDSSKGWEIKPKQ